MSIEKPTDLPPHTAHEFVDQLFRLFAFPFADCGEHTIVGVAGVYTFDIKRAFDLGGVWCALFPALYAIDGVGSCIVERHCVLFDDNGVSFYSCKVTTSSRRPSMWSPRLLYTSTTYNLPGTSVIPFRT